jgi:hypothetical protein
MARWRLFAKQGMGQHQEVLLHSKKTARTSTGVPPLWGCCSLPGRCWQPPLPSRQAQPRAPVKERGSAVVGGMYQSRWACLWSWLGGGLAGLRCFLAWLGCHVRRAGVCGEPLAPGKLQLARPHLLRRLTCRHSDEASALESTLAELLAELAEEGRAGSRAWGPTCGLEHQVVVHVPVAGLLGEPHHLVSGSEASLRCAPLA